MNNKMFILKNILLAQIASDGGKGIEELIETSASKKEKYARKMAYNKKEEYILQAIRTIRRSKTDVNYYVEEKGDQNGYPSIIVYFDFKINNKRKQVSFHTPYNKASTELYLLKGSGRKTRWSKNIGGSREACFEIKEYLKSL